MKKVLFLVPYPVDEAPSQRFRFEQYFSLLQSHNVHVRVQAFFQSSQWRLFFQRGRYFSKALALLNGFARRLAALFYAPSYDFVFLHREAAPLGPPVFEWLISKVLKKNIIYDFDDAIWLTDKINESQIEKILRWRSKVSTICKWSHKVSCGNEYLATFARKYNKGVIVNPTTIDTVQLHNPQKLTKARLKSDSREITIGWTGSQSTLKYLKSIEPVLQELENRFEQISFLIIADKKPVLSLQRLRFCAWNKVSEAADLSQIDIGIMPLPDDQWAQGKCGFKALQYMALDIATVASPVGVNKKIIEHGRTGFLCTTPDEWLTTLTSLVIDGDLRKRIGARGRQVVVDQFSVNSNSSNFLSLFE